MITLITQQEVAGLSVAEELIRVWMVMLIKTQAVALLILTLVQMETDLQEL
jgi:hypothetical protein